MSLSFFAADVTALTDRVADLQKAGVKVRRATVLRALVHLTPVTEMVALTARLASDYALGKVAAADGPVWRPPHRGFSETGHRKARWRDFTPGQGPDHRHANIRYSGHPPGGTGREKLALR